MNRRTPRRRWAFLFMTALVSLAVLPAPLPAQDADPVSVVYLVRHAEKADDGSSDPPLTAEGHARAAALARILADVPLTTVLSTAYDRTLSTADPVAEAHGLEVETYEPGAAGPGSDLAQRLQSTPGHHLVVGHSNTTPALVAALGGDPGEPIDEAGEYDRLYVVWIGPTGRATSSLLRFGEAYEPGG